MVFGMGVTELIIILIVVLIIFGPKNLPKIGSAIGKTVKNIREGMGGDKDKEGEEEESSDESIEVAEEAADSDADADTATTTAAAYQFCPACGARNDATAAFCCKCGHQLASTTAAAEENESPITEH